MEQSIYEKFGGTYSEVNGYLIPNVIVTDSSPTGKWGRMRKKYLQEQHPLVFSELLLSEQLYPHLIEIDEACRDRLALIERQMAEREGVTEELKAADQMKWVRCMENIRSRAEEIVLSELIYSPFHSTSISPIVPHRSLCCRDGLFGTSPAHKRLR